MVSGQITVPEDTAETTQVRTLPGEMDIAGALVTADAARTCAGTARYLAGDYHADYLLTIVFAATSRADLTAAEISGHTRRHWGIGNLEHRPRDTVWREDDQQAHHGNGPRAMATLRNLALGLFAIHGVTKNKQTVRSSGRNPLRSVPLIT